ncbi:MAG: hypothetical protein F4Y94_06305 [Chloroflexi bacterium]|nr:hypothetical protein [Chloroflexota bacterium]
MALAAATAMAVLVISSVPVRGALADGSEDISWSGTAFHWGQACPPSERVANSTATCLDAEYDNSPPASAGYGAGSYWTAENDCSAYGDLEMNVDLINETDQHAHLDNANKKDGGTSGADIRALTCCIEDSDLCIKSQVEKNNDGNISRWAGDLRFTTIDVSTHEARYTYCQEYPDDIYCEVDPEGDANTAPTCTAEGAVAIEGIPECPCGDGDTNDRLCTADDCEDAFADSPSLATGTLLSGTYYKCAFSTDDWADFEASVDSSGTQCTIDTRCPTGGITFYDDDGNELDPPQASYNENSITNTINLIGSYANCLGTLTRLNCAEFTSSGSN